MLPGHGPAGGPELLDQTSGTPATSDYQLPVILDFGMQAAAEGHFYPEIMQTFLNQDS